MVSCCSAPDFTVRAPPTRSEAHRFAVDASLQRLADAELRVGQRQCEKDREWIPKRDGFISAIHVDIHYTYIYIYIDR